MQVFGATSIWRRPQIKDKNNIIVFLTENSLETKKTAKEEKSTELDRVEKDISDDTDGLKQGQKSLDAALEELQELHKACIDTGMSFEERAAAREEELQALKQALCILDKQGPVQTEDC